MNLKAFMANNRFLLSSEQLELLLAFEDSQGLNQLASIIGRDPSVVSRGLQRIAEEYPVLEKIRGRWQITPLGKQTNEISRDFIKSQKSLFSSTENKAKKSGISISKNTVLLVINAQQGLLDATQLGRNNSEAEANISALLKHWRTRKMPVIHIKHVSNNPSSIFYRNSSGCNFLAEAGPVASEEVVEKTKSSSFFETALEEVLKKIEVSDLVLVGFTANECIDATAKDASALGYSICVVGDATAMFDMKSPEGKLLKAERIHKLTLANISAFYAKVVSTADLIS